METKSKSGRRTNKRDKMDEKRTEEKILKIINKRVDEAKGKVNLHLGCGHEIWDGYINLDLNPSVSEADIFCDSVNPPFQENSVDRIETYHMIEHLGHQRCLLAFQNWFKLLKKGGKLVVECPNLAAAIEAFSKLRYNSGEIKGDWGDGSVYETIYGGQKDKGSYHLACFTRWQMVSMLKTAGFNEWHIVEENPVHGKEYGKDWNLRFVCEKV